MERRALTWIDGKWHEGNPKLIGPMTHAMWQASLVYTGVTRARRRAMVLGDPALLQPCLGNWPTRGSGLVDALQ